MSKEHASEDRVRTGARRQNRPNAAATSPGAFATWRSPTMRMILATTAATENEPRPAPIAFAQRSQKGPATVRMHRGQGGPASPCNRSEARCDETTERSIQGHARTQHERGRHERNRIATRAPNDGKSRQRGWESSEFAAICVDRAVASRQADGCGEQHRTFPAPGHARCNSGNQTPKREQWRRSKQHRAPVVPGTQPDCCCSTCFWHHKRR